MKSLLDAVHDFHNVSLHLMLPNPEDGPPLFGQTFRVATITIHIPAYLSIPVCLIGLRSDAMFGAAVPEAAIEENRYSSRKEHEVGLAEELEPESISETSSPRRATET